jgi:hypothetical protein
VAASARLHPFGTCIETARDRTARKGSAAQHTRIWWCGAPGTRNAKGVTCLIPSPWSRSPTALPCSVRPSRYHQGARGVCYFVSIGSRAPARLLARVFDEHTALDVAASPVCVPVARAFPVGDEVCLVTWRGCSCDFVGPERRTPNLVGAFQRCVVKVARELGSVRLLVHHHREPCRLPAPVPRLGLTVHEFVSREHWFVEDVVMEVSRSGPPALTTVS